MRWHAIKENAPMRESIDIIWMRIKPSQDLRNNKNSQQQQQQQQQKIDQTQTCSIIKKEHI